MPRKRLPIGIQTFRKIREDGCYYVDKTGFALRLVEEGTHYFLSRPRRFGKSLFLDTLAELFSGTEELFRGLQAHARWDWGRRFPVIRLSFGGGVVQSRAELDRRIRALLHDNAERLGLPCRDPDDPVGCFAELIARAHAEHGERVVVLVDEYDKPILDNLTRPDVAREARDGLRNLYSVIKDNDAHIRFAFLTGVSKFSKVSLFSGLNNLRDITVSAEYSAICGYTEGDLDQVFSPELTGLDRDQIRTWYNGYNWTGAAVYNPFDLLLLFQEREFRPWWFETATPTFLVDVLTERHTDLPRLEHLLTTEQLLGAFDVERITTEALLWQTGYLTIDRVQRAGAFIQYRLRYPNLEVRAALNAALLDRLGGGHSEIPRQTGQLYALLQANDFSGMQQLFTAFFASIPHDWYRNNPIARYEGYYASVFYAYFASLGVDLTPEESSNAGRLDMALRFNGQVYLFEFKVVELAPDGGALAQLKAKGYADRHRGSGEPIQLIGVEFSREQRRVVGFDVETLGG
ncbi:ATP-binding protein [uncultured Thiohalocapsa sp.]|uniref:ATP-binding protein n=1 Tax=uncultured Thiohalocapsa sp. TaxID=768990 RepID=UPI0025CE299C|nr:ATP-binding protein [uncultured Thiohalocapsa sp.]